MVNGIGSGLDIQGIVDNLMVAQKRNLNQLNDKKNILNYQQTAYSQLKDSLKTFETKWEKLNTVLQNNSYKVTSSNEKTASAVASSASILPGIYALNVTQLATTHQISSEGFASKTAPIGLSGDLTIEVNNTPFSLSISSEQTLEQIRDNINNSNNNPGVAATLLKVSTNEGNDEYRLILSSTESGVDHALKLGGSALPDLHLTQELSAAKNAQFTLNGFQVERSSNMISDVLDGVSFHLNGELGLADIAIESDVGNEEVVITAAIKDMLDTYNSIMGLLSKNQTVKHLRDNTYSMIKVDLKHVMESRFSNGGINSLLDLGVKLDSPQKKTNEDGVEYVVGGLLTIDNSVLSKAIKENKAEVVNLFENASDGIIKHVTSVLSDVEGKTIFNREHMITQQNHQLERKINDEEARLSELRLRFVAKYSSLDTFLERYNQLSSFLDQQLDALSGRRKK